MLLSAELVSHYQRMKPQANEQIKQMNNKKKMNNWKEEEKKLRVPKNNKTIKYAGQW